MPKLPTASKIKRVVVSTQKGQVYIFFGSDPQSGAPFEASGWYLHKRLTKKYKNSKVVVNTPQNIETSGKVMQFLFKQRNKDEDKIRELHFFSHSWQSGLSLKYGGTPTNQDLKDLEAIYGSLVRQNIGPDDYNQFNEIQLRISNFHYLSEDQIKKVRASFTSGALARFWGCNNGYDTGDNNPYTNIAETFSQYANIVTYGAPKGSNFYAYINNKWTTKHSPVGKKAPWPFELRPSRYHRSKQSNKFSPTVTLAALVKKKLKPKIPILKYLDDHLNEIQPDPSNNELVKLKVSSTVLFFFDNLEDSQKKVTLYRKDGSQILFDKMMTIPAHSEWSLSADKKTANLVKGRNLFQGTLHNMSTLTTNGLSGKEFYFKIEYQGQSGTKTFEFKKTRFTFTQ